MKYSDIIKEELKDQVWINHKHTRISIWERFEKVALWFILIGLYIMIN